MPPKFWKFLFAALNAFLMLIFAFYLISLPYVHGDDMLIIEYGAKIKNILLGLEQKPPKDSFIFINVAYDRQLSDKLDTNGFVIGKEAIVHRKKLAQFFEILGKKPQNQKFILCDIHFADSSSANLCEADSISYDFRLAKALEKLPNIILSYHLDDKGKAEYPIFRNIPRGLSDYATHDNIFLKFKLLLQDSLKTTPLLMYEYLHKKKLEKGYFFDKLNGNYILNTFIVDFHIRNYDLFWAKENYKVDNLENILSGAMSEDDIWEYVKNRIIVIGDFTLHDTHQTIYGDTSGSLILLNSYLALKNKENTISLWFVLFLYVCFFITSLEAFRQKEETNNSNKIVALIKSIDYVLILITTSILSFFIFEIGLSILYLSVFLFILKNAFGFIKKRIARPQSN